MNFHILSLEENYSSFCNRNLPSNWSNCSTISDGRLAPTCCEKYCRNSANSSVQNCFGVENSSFMSTSSLSPSKLMLFSDGRNPIGDFTAMSSSPSHRLKIQSRTRIFSPKPGHINPPFELFLNQFTLKIVGIVYRLFFPRDNQ